MRSQEALSEIRPQVILNGDCVTDEAHLFVKLDTGRGTHNDFRRAQEACVSCPEYVQCLAKLSSLAIKFADAGVSNTMIAGVVLESRLPPPPLPLRHTIEQPGIATRRRLSRSYWQDGRLLQIEYKELPSWFLAEFSGAPSKTRLDPIRKLTRSQDTRLHIGGHVWNKHAHRLSPYVQDLSLPTKDFTDEDNEALRNNICRFYSRIELNLDTFRDPDIQTLRELTMEYIHDVIAIKQVGFGSPLRVALSYSPAECVSALANPVYKRYLTRSDIIQAFDQKANATAMLDRYCEWLPRVQAQYAGEARLTKGVLRYIVFRAARQDKVVRLESFIEGYLERFDTLQKLSAHLPSIRDHDIRSMAMGNSSPQKANKALEMRLKSAHQLAKTYGVSERLVYAMAARYKQDLEGKLRRYRGNIDLLQLRYNSHPDLTLTDLQYFADHYAAKPQVAVDAFLHGLEALRVAYPTDDTIDDDAKKAIARHYSQDSLYGALVYLDIYRGLRERFRDDDYLEDWMLRQTAIYNPRAGRKSPVARALYLRELVKRGGLKIIGKQTSADIRALHSVIADKAESPEHAIIAKEEHTSLRTEISGILLKLTKTEREAIIHAFSLDWLLSDQIATKENVAIELGIGSNSLEEYVQRYIVPKLEALWPNQAS